MTQSIPENIYFVGAGGIGMAALERYFLARGCRVAGYDRTSSPLTAELAAEGVDIVFDDDPDLIPTTMRNPQTTLVVYTPAVPSSHRGLTWFRENGFRVVKRAEILGLVTRDSRAICFAGTHGKTTTSSMAAHLLQQSGRGSNAFLGGELRNYGTNFLLSDSSPFSVIEADEYDRSFHHLTPEVAVITATDPDHLDIYGTEEAYLESFAVFTELIRPGGALVMHTGMKLKPRVGKDVRVFTYSRDNGDFHAENIRRGNGEIVFDFVGPDSLRVNDISLGVPVEVNIENAVAALAALAVVGELDKASAAKAMASFMGAKRRFEFLIKTPDHAVIDDYAHHPDELRAAITSVKALYPDRRLTVAFQPHLYSRTRDFAEGFAEALSLADEVILLDIYPAREEPIPGVTSQIIYDRLTCEHRSLIRKEDLAKTAKSLNFETLLTAGAGDISETLPALIEVLTERFALNDKER